MTTPVQPPTSTLAEPLQVVGRSPLAGIPPALAERIRRRVVDAEALSPRLGVAAFNSAT